MFAPGRAFQALSGGRHRPTSRLGNPVSPRRWRAHRARVSSRLDSRYSLSLRKTPLMAAVFTNPVRAPDLSKLYISAKRAVVEAGYLPEIIWQESVSFDAIGEPEFLREYAWVVLTCGMRESVVRQRFDLFSRCFWSWECSSKITATAEACRRLALGVFNHQRKIDAILHVTDSLAEVGFESFRECLRNDPLKELQRLPYIGPVTRFHLAKNLGMDVAKPDRHLCRIVRSLGFQSAQDLCTCIAQETGEAVRVVDLVLWRFATLKRSYVAELKVAAGY